MSKDVADRDAEPVGATPKFDLTKDGEIDKWMAHGMSKGFEAAAKVVEKYNQPSS